MNNTHPCANKCSEFKDGGQCFHCLINETVNRGVYSMHRTEHRIDHIVERNDMGDDTHIENHISPLCKTESQPVLIVESDNQIIERLKAENVVLQAKVDELQANFDQYDQWLGQRNRDVQELSDIIKKHAAEKDELQKRVDALKGLVIELKKLDMENGSIEITSEFVEEIICDFEQALKGDEEYIRAQCGMLGGGGEA